MENYQKIKECLLSMKSLETRETMFYLFHMELINGKTPFILRYNQTLNYQYLRFKYQYLQEVATSRALLEQQEYLNMLDARDVQGLSYAA